MSRSQTYGVAFLNAVVAILFVVILVCVAVIAIQSASVAIRMGAWGVALVVLLLEILKPLLPLAYWTQVHDQPIMAKGALSIFVGLLAISIALTVLRSVFFPSLGETDRGAALIFLVCQAIASGGPLAWYNMTKWIDDKPHDGLPHAYRPGYQPVQLEAQPAPQALPLPETHGVMASIGTAFGHWLEDKLDEDPSGSVEFTAALASYNSWAMPLNYPVADQAIFGSLVMDLVSQTPKISFENGHIIGVRFTEDVDQSFKDA